MFNSTNLLSKKVKQYGLSLTIAATSFFNAGSLYAQTPPTISVTSPVPNQEFDLYPSDNNQVSVTVSTSPTVVDSVKYYLVQTICDGPGCSQVSRFTLRTAPYTLTYTPVYTKSGFTQVSAVAYRNGVASNITAANQITYYVKALPEVTITSPGNNASFTRSVTSIPVTVSLNTSVSNIASVQYTVVDTKTTGMGGDITTRTFTSTASPFGFTLPVLANETYSRITAVAYNTDGKASKPQQIQISYNDLPVVTITSPLPVNGINPTYLVGGSITISANATDDDGFISRVVFTQGNNPTQVIVSSAPYTTTFTNLPAPAPDGSYWFNVIAYDNSGGSTTALVVVYLNRKPIVTITSPTNNATFTSGSNIAINTIVFDPDFLSGKVEFFNGTVKLGEVTSSPFNYTITNAAAGTYAITAKVTDDKGQTNTSPVLNFTVTGSCTAQAWNATTAYNGGAIVEYLGIKYLANWWTYGEQPNTHNGGSGTGQPWLSQGTCNSRIAQAAAVELSAYPNPFTDQLTVNGKVSGTTAQVSVSDLNGVALLSNTVSVENGNVNTTFSTAGLSTGIYIVRIVSGDDVVTFRVVK